MAGGKDGTGRRTELGRLRGLRAPRDSVRDAAARRGRHGALELGDERRAALALLRRRGDALARRRALVVVRELGQAGLDAEQRAQEVVALAPEAALGLLEPLDLEVERFFLGELRGRARGERGQVFFAHRLAV